MSNPDDMTLVALKAMAQAIGYHFERAETETQIVFQMVKPDGSIAVASACPKPRHEANGNDPLLRPGAAAKLLGVTTETLRRWMKSGKLAFVEVGPFKSKRARLSDVERLKIGE